MQDDFNTPDAITALFEWTAEANQLLQQDVVNAAEIHALLELFAELNAVLRIYTDVEPELLDEDIERLIQERVEARKSKTGLVRMRFVMNYPLKGFCWRILHRE